MGLEPSVGFSLSQAEDLQGDFELNFYRSREKRALVTEFYTQLTGNAEVAEAILSVCDQLNINPSLAFSLAWAESRFNPMAVNRNSGSIDRGLFQLNSKSFPSLSLTRVFDPKVNAWYGLNHLKEALKNGGSVTVGLAVYNAGLSRVLTGGTPRSTLFYIDKILGYKNEVENRFYQEVIGQAPLQSLQPKVVKTPKSLLDRGRILE